MRREIFCLSKLNIQNESAKAQKRCKSLKNCRITNSTAKKHKFALREVKGVRGTILVFDSSFILFRSGTCALKLVKSAIAENAQKREGRWAFLKSASSDSATRKSACPPVVNVWREKIKKDNRTLQRIFIFSVETETDDFYLFIHCPNFRDIQ